MFQYAFALALAKRTGKPVLLDTSFFDKYPRPLFSRPKVARRRYELALFNIPLSTTDALKAAQARRLSLRRWPANTFRVVREKNPFLYEEELLAPCQNSYFEGYFQHPAYLAPVENELRRTFTFPAFSPQDTRNRSLAGRIQQAENAVFIHVRRGDYQNLPGWNLQTGYYIRAIERAREELHNPQFFVFADEQPELLRQEIPFPAGTEFAGSHNHQQGQDFKDLQLMSLCRHGIMANSSFSWWGAWLIKEVHKMIFIPSPFIDGQDGPAYPNWIKIPASYR